MNETFSETSPARGEAMLRLLVFRVGAQRFATDLNSIERVTRAAAITPVPPHVSAPLGLAGVLNVGGRVLPVFNGRVLFGAQLQGDAQSLEAREPQLSDEFLITDFESVVWVERVEGVWETAPQNGFALENETSDSAPDSAPNASSVRGLVKREGELIWVCDFTFLPRWKNAMNALTPAV